MVDNEWLIDSTSKQLLPSTAPPPAEKWWCPQHVIASVHRFTLRDDPTFRPYVMAHEVAVAMDMSECQLLAQVGSIPVYQLAKYTDKLRLQPQRGATPPHVICLLPAAEVRDGLSFLFLIPTYFHIASLALCSFTYAASRLGSCIDLPYKQCVIVCILPSAPPPPPSTLDRRR
jgi:hypothetical protein